MSVSPLDLGVATDRAAVRVLLSHRVSPEFRESVIYCVGPRFYPGVHQCRIDGCDRPVHALGLCNAHRVRWARADKPDIDKWVATTRSEFRGRGQVSSCAVRGCEFGNWQRRLCELHHTRWRRTDEPVEQWTAEQVPDHDAHSRYAICAIPWCSLRTSGRAPFCRPHRSRWHRHGKPDVDSYLEGLVNSGISKIDLRGLPDELRLETQYVIQERIDSALLRTHGSLLMPAVRHLQQSDIASVLDCELDAWERSLDASNLTDAAKAFLRRMWHLIDAVAAGEGWAGQYPRDSWDLRALGIERTRQIRFLRFGAIPQPWLRELAKQFIRWRLSIEISLSQITRDLLALNCLSQSLSAHTAPPQRASEFNRDHLEAFLADITVRYSSPQTRRLAVGSIGVFLTAIRQHGWDESLPSHTIIYKEDLGRGAITTEVRRVDEYVMAQVESQQNMDRWLDPEDRLIAQLIIKTGRRLGEAVSLRVDCVMRDGSSGDPYLRYLNHKMKREAFAPLDEDLAAGIHAQVTRIRSRWPDGDRALFPKHKTNPEGTIPRPGAVFRRRLYQWLADCDIRDEHGRPVHITPHQWRHTFATRLVEDDVSIEVVRRLLDHESIAMTGHYARVGMQRARQEWERVRKVDAQGQQVRLDPREELSDSAYLAHAVNQSRHALSNGHCRLTAHQACQHVNPCLSCPMFLTTPEFLPQHHEHRERLQLQLVDNTHHGRNRAVEKNQQDLDQLTRIIDELETPGAVNGMAASDTTDHLSGDAHARR